MNLSLLKVIDVHKNEQGSVTEMLVTTDSDRTNITPEEDFDRAVWMPV